MLSIASQLLGVALVLIADFFNYFSKPEFYFEYDYTLSSVVLRLISAEVAK
jgi:hypothetical protein